MSFMDERFKESDLGRARFGAIRAEVASLRRKSWSGWDQFREELTPILARAAPGEREVLQELGSLRGSGSSDVLGAITGGKGTQRRQGSGSGSGGSTSGLGGRNSVPCSNKSIF